MQDKQEGQSELVIFEEAGRPVEVRLDAGGDTVWLSQRQMAELFETTPENVLMHLKNIFRDEELQEAPTTKDFLAVQTEGRRQVRRKIRHYNLDAIISVGYRVGSRRAVRFRQSATRLLREHLTRGYTLNRDRLEANARELEAALEVVRKVAQRPELAADTGRGMVDIVARYAQTFLLLQRYDEGLLADPRTEVGGVLPTPAQARAALA
ncbi:MAG: virulence RhuM family protein [Burkholderiaceae bacterium]